MGVTAGSTHGPHQHEDMKAPMSLPPRTIPRLYKGNYRPEDNSSDGEPDRRDIAVNYDPCFSILRIRVGRPVVCRRYHVGLADLKSVLYPATALQVRMVESKDK